MPWDRPALGGAAARRLLLCLLLLGLLLHGHAGVLRQLLGAAHWHASPAAVAPMSSEDDGWLARLLRWRQALQASSPLTGGHAEAGRHGHHHGDSARHHHSHHDTTVVSLERSADSADPLADLLAGSLLQPLGLAQPLHWADVAAMPARWPAAAATAWRSASIRLPERPPQR